MLRGMGILFLMWNVPYAVALWNPSRQRVSLYEAIVMQAIGLVGETILLLTFPAGHTAVRATVRRFILFDGSGLLLLFLAAWLVFKKRKQPS
jgi:cellobiose-specific phosphotransferase system component IIC